MKALIVCRTGLPPLVVLVPPGDCPLRTRDQVEKAGLPGPVVSIEIVDICSPENPNG